MSTLDPQGFGDEARTYDRYRTPPVQRAVDWLVPRGCERALDLAAGTGLLTRRLVERIDEVLAVDPDPRMLAVLGENCPRVDVREGAAEDIPLPDDRVEAVFVSSAWHWIDQPRALPEIARVLEPGGRLGIVWTRWADAPWLDDLLQDLARHGVDLHHVQSKIARSRELGPLSCEAPFEVEDFEVFSAHQRMTRDEVAGLYTTYSWFLQHPRRDELRATIGEHVARLDEIVEMPVVSQCFRIQHVLA